MTESVWSHNKVEDIYMETFMEGGTGPIPTPYSQLVSTQDHGIPGDEGERGRRDRGEEVIGTKIDRAGQHGGTKAGNRTTRPRAGGCAIKDGPGGRYRGSEERAQCSLLLQG